MSNWWLIKNRILFDIFEAADVIPVGEATEVPEVLDDAKVDPHLLEEVVQIFNLKYAFGDLGDVFAKLPGALGCRLITRKMCSQKTNIDHTVVLFSANANSTVCSSDLPPAQQVSQ